MYRRMIKLYNNLLRLFVVAIFKARSSQYASLESQAL